MAALTLIGTRDASAAFGPLIAWGTLGTAPGQFNTPDGVAADALGHVYVVDRANNRIQKFSSTGRFLVAWGKDGGSGAAGNGNGEFNSPYGVAVDGWGDVYVADTHNNRIQKFSSSGAFITRWGRNAGDGSPGLANGEFNDPRGVAVDDLGHVYVADHNNNRIQKFTRSGLFLTRWGAHGGDGTAGAGNGEFRIPRGMAIDHAGNIYVADKGNHRVQELSATGAFIRRWGANGGDGTPGVGNGQFNLPYNVALDNSGDVWVTDVANHRIQKFSPAGAFLAKFGHNGGDGTPGTGAGEFDDPYGVATDCRSNVYVTEEGNARVQKLGVPGLAAPVCPPVLTVKLRSAQRAVARRGLKLTVACDRPCTAIVSATIAGVGSRALRVRAVRRELMPRRPVSVRLALSRVGLRVVGAALRGGKTPRARLTIAASGFSGRAHAARPTVRIAR